MAGWFCGFPATSNPWGMLTRVFVPVWSNTIMPKPDTAPKQEDDGFASFVRERDEE